MRKGRVLGALALALVCAIGPVAAFWCVGDYCELKSTELTGKCTTRCPYSTNYGTLKSHLCFRCGKPYLEHHIVCDCD